MRQYEFVADGSDNFDTRYAVADACAAENRPLVSAAVGRFDGSITVLKPFETRPDGRPWPSYRDLFPEPPPAAGPVLRRGRRARRADRRHRHAAGAGVIKLITGIGEPLLGRLLLYDALAPASTRSNTAAADASSRCGIAAGVRPLGRCFGHPRPSPTWTASSTRLSAHRLTPRRCAPRPRETGFWLWRCIVGCAFSPKPDHFYLGKLAVAPGWRGRGMERRCRACSKPIIELQTRVELAQPRTSHSASSRRATAHEGYRPTSVTMRKALA